MNGNKDITHKNKAPEERNVCYLAKNIVCCVKTGFKSVSAL